MSVTTKIQCDSSDAFDLYGAVSCGKITLSIDRHLVLLDYDVDNLGISAIIENSIDPTGSGSHGDLYYNSTNGKIYFSDGNQYILVGTILPREGVNVISRNMTDPPLTANEGDQYLVSNLPTGAWAPYKNQIAYYTGNSWEFTVPEPNQIIGVENEYCDYQFSGTSWTKLTSTYWVEAVSTDPQLVVNGSPFTVSFGDVAPGIVSSSTSGSPGVALLVSRADHDHSLGPHSHADNTAGGQIAHAVLTAIGPNDHHNQVHSGLDHTGIIGVWAQINFANSSLADIVNRSHTLLQDVGQNTHIQIDAYMVTHDHDGQNSQEVAFIDGGSF